MFPLIALEEHYTSLKVLPGAKDDHHHDFPEVTRSKLEDLGDGRIQDLDKGAISLQVISHTPRDAPAAYCSEVNDELAVSISKTPDRLAGFAMLPMEDPKAAADELSRCVTKHGFLGALISAHLDGQFYDDERFLPVFERAQELDVPIYLHPTYAAESMMPRYRGNYDEKTAIGLSAYGFGWHADTAVSVLRLYASGLFDRYPKFKLVIGHMGELLPFQIDRTARTAEFFGRERSFMDVWKNSIWVTTSGMFSLPSLACLLQTTTIDHVMYSLDYPFSGTEKGKDFMGEIEKSGLMSTDDLEKFSFRNAEALLKVKAKSLD